MEPLTCDAELAKAYPHLVGRHPRPSGSTLTLPSGRALGYCVYPPGADADTAAPPDAALGSHDGQELRTIVLLPGIPGSRFFTHPQVKAQGGRIPGCRLYVLERPGLGLSSPAPAGYSYRQFAEDLREFCAQLQLRDVLLIGYSAGTPFATAAACLCGPELLSGVALVSAIGPPDTPNAHTRMSWLFRFAYWACRRAPWLVRMVVNAEARNARSRPLHALREGFRPYTSAAPADAAALARPDVMEAFVEGALELYGRHQETSVFAENLLFTRPWGFQLGDCRVPVAIWQGEDDAGCTREMAQHLVATMPGAKLTLVPKKGHLVYFDVWGDVLAWLLGLPPAPWPTQRSADSGAADTTATAGDDGS